MDPAHDIVDIRFYEMLPTSFFIISDDRLYISFLLSKPVAECAAIEIDGSAHSKILNDFLAHFNFYWKESRSFVCVVGLRSDGSFIMIRNRKRCWEWPAGYLEPIDPPEDPQRRANFVRRLGTRLAS